VEFQLTPELTDRIIFAMENQHEEYVLDTAEVVLLTVDELPDETGAGDAAQADRFVPLPDWTPAHGFRLMERFVDELRNPVYREKLAEALGAGRGVFRRFKDTVKERPDIERRWHQFKDQAMREVVAEWYNDLRETWGLERVAVEHSETEDLVLSDFALRRVEAGDTALLAEVRRAAEAQRRETGGRGQAPEAAIAIVAEAPAGDVAAAAAGREAAAGEAAAREAPASAGTEAARLLIDTLYVQPAFRGLGLGRLLLERVVEAAREEGWSAVEIELSGTGLMLEETVDGMGFETVSRRVALDLR
jgi:GNAT superfamily N-acetyltransferase